MGRQDDLENRLSEAIQKLANEFSDLGDDLRWSVTRALIHRAVHFGAESQGGVEFCTLSTYLAEMVGHAHKLMHGDSPGPTHKDMVH